jgi:hypothetical protein
MKNFTLVTVIAAFFISGAVASSCKKTAAETNKPIEEIAGKWGINRIELRIYYGGVFTKDSIIPRKPQGENFVQFDAGTKAFQYRFNSTTTNLGTYVTKPTDSVVSTAGANTYPWKMLTLTAKLFTAVSTSNNDPGFPGAMVETYYTFVR